MNTTLPSGNDVSFADLLSEASLVEKLKQLNIFSPTPVQAQAIPAAITGQDLIVEAQTGSGKTLAFTLPILLSLSKDSKRNRTYALIITPTRELATQVKNVVHSVAQDFSVACLIGGENVKHQLKDLSVDRRIVVGTPGRILDLLERKELTLGFCKTFVLDEADEMLSMGFIDDIKAIGSLLPKQRQGLFFSATISNGVKGLAYQFLNDAKEIHIERSADLIPKITHSFIRVDGGVASKLHAVHAILQLHKVDSAIVFCNTKSDTELVEVFLKRRGLDAMKINSDLSQKDRDAVLNKLRNGELKFLIATDVAARGIDIKGLDMVINYSIHNEVETYVHRTGRTGRAGEEGRAISLVGPQDFGAFHTVNRQLKLDMEQVYLPTVSG